VGRKTPQNGRLGLQGGSTREETTKEDAQQNMVEISRKKRAQDECIRRGLNPEWGGESLIQKQVTSNASGLNWWLESKDDQKNMGKSRKDQGVSEDQLSQLTKKKNIEGIA